MIIYLGADHGGFKLKEHLKALLVNRGYEVIDKGSTAYDEHDDYPDFARKVAEAVRLNDQSRGILICFSGVGVDVVANRFSGIRSALAISADQIFDARHDDDANVLSLAADYTNEADAERIVRVFLDTPFGGDERFRRRISKIP